MIWSDFAAMLADAAQQPAVVLICVLCVIAAGALCGRARGDAEPEQEPSVAGDTQANWPARLDEIEPRHRP